MLNVSKYSGKMEQSSILFKTLKTPNTGKILAKVLLITTFAFFIMLFLPWQQNIRGTGELTALSPSERPQFVESAIAGRIAEWKVREGQFVNAGDTILVLTEIKEKYFDPLLLERTRDQIEAKRQGIIAKKAKEKALEEQEKALRELLVAKSEQAVNYLEQAEYKLTTDSVDYVAEQIRFKNQEDIFGRNQQLYEAGNIDLTKFQELESKLQELTMKVMSAKNTYLQSQLSVTNAQIELNAVISEYQEKISKVLSDLNNTRSEIFDAVGALTKQENELANLTIRNDQYQLIAPQSGYIIKALKAGVGETIKEGEAVVEILAENPSLAVEMYVRAMDVPLIATGRKVRIEFDGWPALQFSGWPSVSVGTFGGVVQVVDRADTRGKKGEFRILVTPDPEDEPWPEQLRMGSGTKGWVMLDNVAVWYEIWRQLNGFPPSLYEAPQQDVLEKEAAK